MTQLTPDAQVGRYRVVRYLGAGGMSVLYEARHPVLASRVVIKTLHPSMGALDEVAERFRYEALAASRLRDDRLPQIFDVGELPDGTQYLVMEFLDGEDLAQALQTGPLDPGYAARIMLEVLEVLGRVHRLGIVHRDVKPGNIFLARSDLLGEIPKLLDFGIAHIAARDTERAGRMVGTPAYMAPEQILGTAITPSTDIFAAGVVLFELVAGAGERPWVAPSPTAYYLALCKQEQPRPLSDAAPRAPVGLSEVIARALVHDPRGRYKDAYAFLRALEPYAVPRAVLHEAAAGRARREAARGERAKLATVVTVVPRPVNPDAATQITVDTGIGNSTAPATGTAPGSTEDRERRMAALRAELLQLKERVGSTQAGHSTGHASPRRVASGRPHLEEPVSGRPTWPGPDDPLIAPRPVGEPAPRSLLHPGEQRPATLVVLDLALHAGEAMLPEDAVAQLEGPLAEAIAGEFTCRGARVLHRDGGRMIAVFGFPEVREDDAELAATAALAADRRRVEAGTIFDDVGYGVTGRAGVHAGFVALSEDGGAPSISGEALEIAVYLAEQAPLNGVLLSDAAVAQLPALFATRPLGELVLQGHARRLLAHELLGGDSAPWSEIAASARMSRRGQAGPAPFVGRAAEIDALTAAISEVRERGGPGLSLVVGGAGLGKTRMVTELCSRLAPRGRPPTPVVRVVPPPREPYGLWASVLRAFLDPRAAADDESLRESLAALGRSLDPERRAALLRQQPVIAMLLGGGLGGLAEENSPQALGNRIQVAVTLCLTAAARRAAPHAPGDPPLVVVLDDVHRADDSSLAILGPVLAALRAPLPLLVIVTAREGAALDLRGLPQQSAPIVLGPLDDAEAGALARALAGAALSPAACEFVVKRAAGNPLFIEELIPALRGQGLLGAHAERLGGFLPPASLYALLFGRLDRLDADLREMLRIASALGAEFERPLFEAVVEAASAQDSSLLAGRTAREALDDLTHREFLTKSGDVYGFRQAQLQGAVYGTILAENKRALHRLAAEALELLHQGRLDRYLSRLLLHYSRTEDVAKTVRYARLAGLNAYGIGAYEEASDDLMMAAALQDQILEQDPLPAPRTLLDLARAYQWSGRFAQADAAASEAAGRLARIAGASPAAPSREAEALRAEICWTRGYVAEFRSRWDAAIGFFEEAERAFADARRPFDAARVRCHRGFVLRSAGRLTEGIDLARDGWEVLRGSGNLAAVAHAGHDLGNVLRDLGQIDEARRIFDVAVAAGDELWRRGNTLEGTWGALAARSGRGMARAVAGDLDAAVADQRTVIALADQEGHRIAAAFASSHLATHLLDRGDLAEAEAAAARAHALSVELSMPSRALKCRLIQARIAQKQGRGEQALGWLEEAESLARREALGEDAWFDVAERLVAALGPDSFDTSPGVPRLRGPARARVEALAAEGEARAKRSGQPRHRERAAGLVAIAGIFQGEVK